ncbi:MAG TPA: alcohol dehydrogenase, partial [Pirellulales bacterium]|nr:alcohol dehydrogenase [Pirellulales bacterium]
RLGGVCVLAGAVFPGRAVQLEPERVVRSNWTLRGVHNYAPRNLHAAIEFLVEAKKRFAMESLVSKWLPLADADHAFARDASAQHYRIGIRC